MFNSSSGMSAGRATALAPVPRAATHVGRTDVLLISPHEFDKIILERAISPADWYVTHVRTCEEALAVLASVLVPVIVCDQSVAGGHWKEVIKRIFSSPHPAPILLATETYDWRLWIETIDCGGFELVPKPFPGIEEKLHSAVHHWQEGRIRRTWDHFFIR
jgi:DNA-binding NtrC family response regulator